MKDSIDDMASMGKLKKEIQTNGIREVENRSCGETRVNAAQNNSRSHSLNQENLDGRSSATTSVSILGSNKREHFITSASEPI